jgi:hypothetical protein
MFTPPYHPPSPLPLKKGDKQIEIKKYIDFPRSWICLSRYSVYGEQQPRRMHIAVMQAKAALLIVALLAVSCTGLDPAAYGNPSGQLGQKVRPKIVCCLQVVTQLRVKG